MNTLEQLKRELADAAQGGIIVAKPKIEDKYYLPEIEKCSPEVRIRLYALQNAVRSEHPPDIDDIAFLAAYCEVEKRYRE